MAPKSKTQYWNRRPPSVPNVLFLTRLLAKAQVRTSNHRLDGKTVHVRLDDEDIDTGCEKLGCYIGPGARLGVQVIILPGRYIAAESTIGPRITIEQNLPKGKYILKQEISCLVGEE